MKGSRSTFGLTKWANGFRTSIIPRDWSEGLENMVAPFLRTVRRVIGLQPALDARAQQRPGAHYGRSATLKVVSQAEFDRWLAEQSAKARAANAAPVNYE